MADQIIDVPGQGKVAFPDSMSDADIVKAIQATSSQPKFVPEPTIETPAEAIAGHPITRFALGAASPVIGAAQLLTNISPAARMLGLHNKINNHLKTLEDAKRAGMAARSGGDGGFDWAGLAGGIASPATILALKNLPVAAGALGNAKQGAAVGAAVGASTPVVNGGDSFLTDKAVQTGTGATIGAVIPGTVDLVRGGGRVVRNVFDPWFPGGSKRAAGRTLNEAAGDKLAEIKAALSQPRQFVAGETPTAAEAASSAGGATFSGMEKIAQSRKPDLFGDITRNNEAARLRAVRTVSRDDQALADAISNRATNARDNYGIAATQKVSSKSDAQLMQEAIAEREAARIAALQDKGRFQSTAAQQENLARGAPVDLAPKQPVNAPYFNVGATGGRAPQTVPKDGSLPKDVPFRMQGQLPEARLTNNFDQSLEATAAAKDAAKIVAQRAKERDFLQNTTNILKDSGNLSEASFAQFAKDPSIRDAMRYAGVTAKNGPFTVAQLQRMKESLDYGIVAARKSAENGVKPKQPPTELLDTKNRFVEWASTKSPDWAKARTQYHEDSLPINRMQVGQELEKSLRNSLGVETPMQFANAVREAPRTITRATTGAPRYDKLEQILTDKEVDSINAVANSLMRRKAADNLISDGSSRAAELAGAVVPKVPAAGMFNPSYSVVRAISNRIAGRAEGKSLDALSEGMATPEGALKLMNAARIPDEKKKAIISMLAARSAAQAAANQVGKR